MDLDLVDEFYVRAAPEAVAAAFHDEAAWKLWWPDLGLTVFQDRGLAGLRWSVTGTWTGSLEVWLEEKPDGVGPGVLVHHYLRVSDARTMPWRRALRVRHRRAVAWKRHAWALKDRLEADRPTPSSPERAPSGSN